MKTIMMKENVNSVRTLAMLRYRAARYRAMRNGTMCQQVNLQIRRIMDEMDVELLKN